MSGYIRRLKWQRDADGGGETWLFEPYPRAAGVVEKKLVFDLPEELADDVAAAIRYPRRLRGRGEAERPSKPHTKTAHLSGRGTLGLSGTCCGVAR